MIADGPEHQAAGQRLRADLIQRRVPPVVLQLDCAAAYGRGEAQQQAALLLIELLVVVAVARALLQRAVLIIACAQASDLLWLVFCAALRLCISCQ